MLGRFGLTQKSYSFKLRVLYYSVGLYNAVLNKKKVYLQKLLIFVLKYDDSFHFQNLIVPMAQSCFPANRGVPRG